MQKSESPAADDALLMKNSADTVLLKIDSMIALLSSSSSTCSLSSSPSPSPSSSSFLLPTTLRVSLADTIGNQAREEEIFNLRKELAECRDDLERDEEIFAEKVRDLKNCRRELRSTRQDNIDLQDKISDYISKIARNNEENSNKRQEFAEGRAGTIGGRGGGRERGREKENVMEKEYKIEHKSDSDFYNDDNGSNNIYYGHNNGGNDRRNSDSNPDMKNSGNGREDEQDDLIDSMAANGRYQLLMRLFHDIPSLISSSAPSSSSTFFILFLLLL